MCASASVFRARRRNWILMCVICRQHESAFTLGQWLSCRYVTVSSFLLYFCSFFCFSFFLYSSAYFSSFFLFSLTLICSYSSHSLRILVVLYLFPTFLTARVGGGWMRLEEFVTKYSPRAQQSKDVQIYNSSYSMCPHIHTSHDTHNSRHTRVHMHICKYITRPAHRTCTHTHTRTFTDTNTTEASATPNIDAWKYLEVALAARYDISYFR